MCIAFLGTSVSIVLGIGTSFKHTAGGGYRIFLFASS
jgi:hypothetical protein